MTWLVDNKKILNVIWLIKKKEGDLLVTLYDFLSSFFINFKI